MSSAQGLSRIACEHTSSGELCPQLVAWGNLHCAHRACAACSVQLLLSTPQRHPKIPRPPRDNSSCTASLRSTFRNGEFLTLLKRPFGADVSLPDVCVCCMRMRRLRVCCCPLPWASQKIPRAPPGTTADAQPSSLPSSGACSGLSFCARPCLTCVCSVRMACHISLQV